MAYLLLYQEVEAMKMRQGILLGLLLVLGCSVAEEGNDFLSTDDEAELYDAYVDDVQASADAKALSGGRSERGYAPVGFIKFKEGGFCSATLIRDDAAITAAHCVRKLLQSPEQISFHLGTTIKKPKISRTVEQIDVHPKYPINKTDNKVAAYDVAVLHLNRPIAKVALAVPSMELGSVHMSPSDSSTTANSPRCAYRYIGFGSSGKNFSAGRRSMMVCIRERQGVMQYTQSVDGFTCNGDSGGAIIRERTLDIVAVHNGGNCGKTSRGTVYPLDADPTFLRTALASIP